MSKNLQKYDFQLSFKINTDIESACCANGQTVQIGNYSIRLEESDALEILNKMPQKELNSLNKEIYKEYLREKLANSYIPNEPEKIIKNNETKKGSVYLIKSAGFYKIGISASIKDRLNGFKTSLPNGFELICTADLNDYARHEEILHAMFSHKNTNGEWFDLSEDDLQEIQEYLENEIYEQTFNI